MNGCPQLHRDVILDTITGVVDNSVEITHIFSILWHFLLLTVRLVVESNILAINRKHFNFTHNCSL